MNKCIHYKLAEQWVCGTDHPNVTVWPLDAFISTKKRIGHLGGGRSSVQQNWWEVSRSSGVTTRPEKKCDSY